MRAKAIDSNGVRPTSNYFTIDVTAPSVPIPDAPATFTGSIQAEGINFSWSDVNYETSYTIEIHSNSGFTALYDTIVLSEDDTSHLETPMFPDTYWCRIKATNGSGSSSWKNCTSNTITI